MPADEGRVIVDLLARQLAATRDAKRCHAPVRIGRGRREHLELRVAHEVRDIRELERHAKIRLVGAEAPHRLGVTEARKRIGQARLQHAREDVTDEALHQRHHLVLCKE